MRWNELGIGVDSNERPHIASPTRIVEHRHVTLLFLHVAPDFIDLNTATVEVAHSVVE